VGDAPSAPPRRRWAITPGELAAVRGRLEAFAGDVFGSLPRKDQRARGECYLRGLMLDGRRKSVEPMAQRLGEVHYQALHHFVAVSPWDWRPVRRRLAERLVGGLGADRVGGGRHQLPQGR
jgi:SRSO17 transposase